ncbi:MAG TPA: sulfotransferase [Thermoleophilaceae bacterium]|nr:sulfotransferase [Thermoleophilaceae bacterium]
MALDGARPSDHTLTFIGGLHRSGTTLLARCLAEHPSVSGFADTGATEDEGQYLQSVYPLGQQFGGPGKFGFAPAMHMTESSPLVTNANRERLWSEWSPHWDCERPVLVEKSPPNMLKTRFLQALFPGARFILVLRDPIATAFATHKWSGTRLDQLIRHWLVSNETMISDMDRLEHATLVRYEDLVANADDVLTRLHRFLGIEPQSCGVEARAGLNDAYFDRWKDLGRSVPRSLYRELIVRRFETKVNRFGYSLRNPETASQISAGVPSA